MRIVAILLLLFGSAPLWGQEQLFLQPPDLEPGDQYRLLFVTSKFRDATSTDIEDYNQFVQQVADDSPIVGPWGLTWSVIGSTDTVDAKTNTDTDYGDGFEGFGVPIYRLDAVQLVSDYRGLWEPLDFGSAATDGTNITELGLTLSANSNDGLLVFTGTTFDGVGQNAGHLGSTDSVTTGLADSSANIDWFGRALTRFHLDILPFYAMSEVLTAVPEPSSGMLLLTGLLVLAGGRRARIRLLDVRSARIS